MEIDDLAKRVKDLSEATQAKEAAELKQLQVQREAHRRIQEAMQGQQDAPEQPQPPTDNPTPPGESPSIGGAGHIEAKPEQKETELDLRRIEARERPPSHLLGQEGIRRMQGRSIEG